VCDSTEFIKKYLEAKRGKVNKRKKKRRVNTVVNPSVNQSVNPSTLTAAPKMGAPTIKTKELESLILQGIADGYSTVAVFKKRVSAGRMLCTKMHVDRDLLDKYTRVRASGTPQS